MSKKSQKGLVKKLDKAISSFVKDQKSKSAKDVLPLMNQIIEVLNDDSDKNDSASKINDQIYQESSIVTNSINLMPFFDQPTINALSTLLQTTVRKYPDNSLPKYLMNHPSECTTIFSYLENQTISNTAHILLRACLLSRDFTKYLFEKGYVGSFIQYLSGDFAKLAAAFGTYDAILNTHPDISAEFINSNWEIFQIQFKQLLHSPNYLIPSNFLPILSNFLLHTESVSCFRKYLEDVENLQFIMLLLKNSSKRVVSQAYQIFKLFVLNPRSTPQIINALRKNKKQLVSFLNSFQIDDSNPSLEDEKQQLIQLIKSLQ